MISRYIEFKKKREIGDIITDTFKFLRHNFKTIFKLLAKTAGIPFVLFIVVQFYYTRISFSSTQLDFNNPLGPFNTPEVLFTALLMYVCLFLYFAFLFAGIMAIVKSYIKNKGVINEQEVIQNIRDKTMSTITLGILKFLILLISFMLCFFPGVYVMVPMAMVFSILFFEEKSVSESISHSFTIIKNEWWMSFLSLLLVGLLWYIASIVLSLPLMIYMWIKMFTVMQEGSFSDPSDMFDGVTIALTLVASSIQYILYMVVPIGAAFIYFNLNERMNQTGSLEKIDTIGSTDEV